MNTRLGFKEGRISDEDELGREQEIIYIQCNAMKSLFGQNSLGKTGCEFANIRKLTTLLLALHENTNKFKEVTVNYGKTWRITITRLKDEKCSYRIIKRRNVKANRSFTT